MIETVGIIRVTSHGLEEVSGYVELWKRCRFVESALFKSRAHRQMVMLKMKIKHDLLDDRPGKGDYWFKVRIYEK